MCNYPAGFTEISLSRGLVALVDEADYPYLLTHKWYARKNSSTSYAARRASGKTIYMHRLLLCAPSGMHVDHINGDGLDNRRCNLRLATCAQNQQNRRIAKSNKSGFKGVHWDGRKNRWKAHIRIGGRGKNLGSFTSPQLAYAAYCDAAKAQHGEFARFA